MKKQDYGSIGTPIYSFSEEPKEKSNLLKKILISTLITAGAIFHGSQTSEIETKTLKYQGWYPDDEKNTVVFDEKILYERNGESAKYRLATSIEADYLDSIETGKNYKVEIEKKNFGFIFPDKVISIEEVKSD